MREAMLRQEFTLDTMDTLDFTYGQQQLTLSATGKDERGNQYIEIPTNDTVPIVITHVTADKRLKDYTYTVNYRNLSHTYASHKHLIEGLPLVINAVERRGVRVHLK